MTRRERTVVGIILGVALGLRLGWCVWAARPPGPALHDPAFYRLFGEQLAHLDGYRLPGGVATAYYPPGYSFSLAPLFWLVYNTPIPDDVETGVIAALNIVWQLGAVVLVFLIARRLTGRATAGYVAAGAIAVWPNLVFHSAVALTESLFIALLLVALLLAVNGSMATMSTTRLVCVGAVLGAATLVRPVTVPVFLAILIVLLLSRIGWRRAVAQSIIVGAAAAAVLAPWAIRNAIVMNEVTLSTNTGDNLCMSRRLGGSGGFELPNDRCLTGAFETLPRPAFETARDAHGRRLAFEFVREHPGEELRLVARRLVRTFSDDADGIAAVESYGDDLWLSRGVRDGLRTMASTYGAIAAIAGIAGLTLLARRRTPEGWLVVLTGIGLLIPPLVFFGDPRFHVPAVPIVAIGVGVLVGATGSGRADAATR